MKPPYENSDYFLANWSSANDSLRPEEDLYHYTDVGGLFGILGSCQLWATQTNFLNDSSEIAYGLDWISEIVKWEAKRYRELVEKDPEKFANAEVLAAIYEVLDDMTTGYRAKLIQDEAPFVTCLSRAEDSLTQWQAYGRNGGYCLKFDGASLSGSIKQVDEKGARVNPHPNIVIEPVKYELGPVNDQVRTALEDFLKAGQFKSSLHTNSEAFQTFARRLNEISMVMKHTKFWPERERRFCVTGGAETFYTQSALGLVPRMRLKFAPKSLREVMVGPGEHRDARKYSVERFLSRQRYLKHVVVTTSQIPYRDA